MHSYSADSDGRENFRWEQALPSSLDQEIKRVFTKESDVFIVFQ